MPGIRVKEGESIESALKRFKKATEKAGILSEIRKREHYEKPSVKRKKKALAAKKPTPWAVWLRIGAALAMTKRPDCAEAMNRNTMA